MDWHHQKNFCHSWWRHCHLMKSWILTQSNPSNFFSLPYFLLKFCVVTLFDIYIGVGSMFATMCAQTGPSLPFLPTLALNFHISRFRDVIDVKFGPVLETDDRGLLSKFQQNRTSSYAESEHFREIMTGMSNTNHASDRNFLHRLRWSRPTTGEILGQKLQWFLSSGNGGVYFTDQIPVWNWLFWYILL